VLGVPLYLLWNGVPLCHNVPFDLPTASGAHTGGAGHRTTAGWLCGDLITLLCCRTLAEGMVR
jgi:hypothetical protein